MKITDILARGPSYSFEFFPPRTPEAEIALTHHARGARDRSARRTCRSPTAPAASTREKTHDIVTGILRDTTMTPMAHLTCVGHTRAELVEIVTRYRDAGIENILALGGDPPPDLDLPAGRADARGRARASSSASIGDFSVGVAAHPEPHPRRRSARATGATPREKLGEGRLRDHAVLLRRRPLLRSRREPARARRRQAGDPGDHAGDHDRQHQADAAAAGLRVPALARRQARGRRRRSGRGVRGRGRGGDEARARR